MSTEPKFVVTYASAQVNRKPGYRVEVYRQEAENYRVWMFRCWRKAMRDVRAVAKEYGTRPIHEEKDKQRETIKAQHC